MYNIVLNGEWSVVSEYMLYLQLFRQQLKLLGPFFFFAFHFQVTTETLKGSTKMEISTGKNLKSYREKIGKSNFASLENFSSYAPGDVQQHGLTLLNTLLANRGLQFMQHLVLKMLANVIYK